MERREKGWKEIRDAVHGEIELHPLCVCIVDTPEFQRLRNVSQCGLTHLVFPSASHSRFEHCLGVYHLAGVMLKKLEDTGKLIDASDKLSVQIAALCHDLGHGPFSHSWERFVKYSHPDYKHEETSVKLFEYLIKKNDLTEKFDSYGINEKRRKFIGNLILGKPSDNEDLRNFFLYEIVANNDTGVDVDKWDYMLRDALHFGIKTELNYERILSSVAIVDYQGITHIAFRDKVARDILEMFETRERLHRICYQHRVSKVVEVMLIDALLKVDKHYVVRLADGKELKLSDCHEHLEAFVRLSDYLYYELLHSLDPKLSEGREILERITRRKLYPLVSYHVLKVSEEEFESRFEEMKEKYKDRVEGELKFSYINLSIDSDKLNKIFIYDRLSKLVKFPCELKTCDKEVVLILTSYKEKLVESMQKDLKEAFEQLCCASGKSKQYSSAINNNCSACPSLQSL